MGQERRQYRRIPLGASVSFQELRFGLGSEASEAAYRDVSGGGLLIGSPREVPLGTLLKLQVQVPGWHPDAGRFSPAKDQPARPLVAVGQVVRLERLDEGAYELGIKFLNVHPDDWAALLAFLDAPQNDLP